MYERARCVFAELYKDVGLHQRLIAIEKEFTGANILLHKLGTLPAVSSLSLCACVFLQTCMRI